MVDVQNYFKHKNKAGNLYNPSLDRNWLLLIHDRLEELERNWVSSGILLLKVKVCLHNTYLKHSRLGTFLFQLFTDLRGDTLSISLIYILIIFIDWQIKILLPAFPLWQDSWQLQLIYATLLWSTSSLKSRKNIDFHRKRRCAVNHPLQITMLKL